MPFVPFKKKSGKSALKPEPKSEGKMDKGMMDEGKADKMKDMVISRMKKK